MSPNMIEFGFAVIFFFVALAAGAPVKSNSVESNKKGNVSVAESCGKCIAVAKQCLNLPYLSEYDAEDWENKLQCLLPSFEFLAGKGVTKWTITEYSVDPSFEGDKTRADCIDDILYYENEECERCSDNLSEEDAEFVASEWDGCEDEADLDEQPLEYSDEDEDEEDQSFSDEEDKASDSEEEEDDGSLKVFRDQPIPASSSSEEEKGDSSSGGGSASEEGNEEGGSSTTVEPTTMEPTTLEPTTPAESTTPAETE